MLRLRVPVSRYGARVRVRAQVLILILTDTGTGAGMHVGTCDLSPLERAHIKVPRRVERSMSRVITTRGRQHTHCLIRLAMSLSRAITFSAAAEANRKTTASREHACGKVPQLAAAWPGIDLPQPVRAPPPPLLFFTLLLSGEFVVVVSPSGNGNTWYRWGKVGKYSLKYLYTHFALSPSPPPPPMGLAAAKKVSAYDAPPD